MKNRIKFIASATRPKEVVALSKHMIIKINGNAVFPILLPLLASLEVKVNVVDAAIELAKQRFNLQRLTANHELAALGNTVQ